MAPGVTLARCEERMTSVCLTLRAERFAEAAVRVFDRAGCTARVNRVGHVASSPNDIPSLAELAAEARVGSARR